MSGRIAVTGIGIISSLGIGPEATFAALREGRSGIRPVRFLDTNHKELPVGEVSFSDAQLARLIDASYPESELRTVLLGIIAARQALGMAACETFSLRSTAFISGTTVGGMDKTERYFDKVVESEGKCEETAELKFNDCGYSSSLIADSIGNFGLVTTISTACSSAANAIILGAELINSGMIERAVVGGAESLSRFHVNGFNTLMILDSKRCRPFSDDREGINLGEGAAYLVLEAESNALVRGVTPLAILKGYGNACDAYHQTATSENADGPYLAMSKALDMAALSPADIDYVNAHGTGTPNNDASEIRAMRRIWSDKLPFYSSTKSYTGHTTSAAGAIESVISILSLQKGFIPGNLGTNGKGTIGMDSPLSESLEHRDVRNVLTNSFGFGGNDSSLIFSRYE